jgi:mRNA-degrading endonuclease RelE of RelBE toxin-antitoxin system
MSDEWDWELTDTADRQFDGLDEYAQDRISSKLDEIVAEMQFPICLVPILVALESIYRANVRWQASQGN